MDYVDNYCERIAPGLWGEPANASTNLAFLIASALLIWSLSRAPGRVPVSVWLLPVTTGVVGLCSLAFHTFATGFTGMLDTLSIAVFTLLGGVRAVLGGYLSALLVLVGFGLAIRHTAPAAMRRFGTLLLWAAVLFATSLTLRTLDGPLCAELPVGTHFLWHCLNATVLFVVSYAVIRCWRIAVPVSTGSPR